MSDVKIKLETDNLDALIRLSSRKKFRISDRVEYGVFQEFSSATGGRARRSGRGTTGRGHPSLLPAFTNETKALPKLISSAITNLQDLTPILRSLAFRIQRRWAGDVNVDTGAYRNSIHVEEEFS